MDDAQESFDVLAEESKSIQKEFNEKWNYWMIAKSVSEFTGQTFYQVLDDNVMNVLTVATLLKEQVTVEENKHGKLTT